MDFKLKKKDVELLDGDGQVVGKLVVTQATLPTEQLLSDLEDAAREANLAFAKEKGDERLTSLEQKRMVFRETMYPKLAACSSGDVPSEEEAFSMPIDNISRWYDAAYELNRPWFKMFDDLEKQLAAPEENEEKKKEEPKRAE